VLEGKLGNQLKNDEGMCASGKWVRWFVREKLFVQIGLPHHYELHTKM